MKKFFALAALLAVSSFALATDDTPRPDPTPVPCIQCNNPAPVAASSNPVATATASPSAASRASATGGNALADASNAVSIEGDNSKSLVAVFPPPSTAVVPAAQNCIVTHSKAGGVVWNFVQAAESTQGSDPVCVLMWLYERTSVDQRGPLTAEIMKRIAE